MIWKYDQLLTKNSCLVTKCFSMEQIRWGLYLKRIKMCWKEEIQLKVHILHLNGLCYGHLNAGLTNGTVYNSERKIKISCWAEASSKTCWNSFCHLAGLFPSTAHCNWRKWGVDKTPCIRDSLMVNSLKHTRIQQVQRCVRFHLKQCLEPWVKWKLAPDLSERWNKSQQVSEWVRPDWRLDWLDCVCFGNLQNCWRKYFLMDI